MQEATASYGTLYMKVTFLPFIQPTYDDEETEAEKAKKAKIKKKLVPPTNRVVSHDVQDHVKVRAHTHTHTHIHTHTRTHLTLTNRVVSHDVQNHVKVCYSDTHTPATIRAR